MSAPVYTRSEKLKRARLLAKGAHNAYGDTSRIDQQIDRIDATAADRGRREAEAHQRAVNTAKDEVAAARVKERSAPRAERQAAREERRAAETRLRLVERAAR